MLPAAEETVSRCSKGCVQFFQSKARLLDASQREVGVGVDQAGGELQPHVGTGEIGFCFTGRLLRLAAEIVVLRQGDVPLGACCHSFRRFPAAAGWEGRVHQRHEHADFQHPVGSRLYRSGIFPLLYPARVTGFLRIGGNGPGFSKLQRAGDPSLGAQLLHGPGG